MTERTTLGARSTAGTGPVLVATDLSPSADLALREGHRRASALGVELAVCHVAPSLSRSNVLFPQQQTVDLEAREEVLRGALQAVVERTREVTGRGPDAFRAIVDDGVPYASVVRHAEDVGAQLVVIGDRGATGLSRMLLGGVAQRVMRYAHAPVLVVRAAGAPGAVLVASDLSDPSLPAIAAAARERADNTVALYCLELAQAVAAAEYGIAWRQVESPELVRTERALVAERLARACDQVGLAGERRVEVGAAGPTILQVAEEVGAHLIVLGTRGRTGLRRILLGSVAEFVATHASCSVLVVRLADS